MMWSILLISFLALKGGVCNWVDGKDDFSIREEVSNSAACDYVGYVQENCMPELKGKKVGAPTEELLEESCPFMLKYADCIEDTLKLCSDLDHAVRIAKSQIGVMRDLCDKDSDFRKSYLRMAPCYMGLNHYYPFDDKCFRSGFTIYEAYLNSSMIQVNIGDYDKRACFSSAYTTACTIATVDRVCGAEASAVVIEFLTRSKSLEERCPGPYIQEVKDEYFQFLKRRFDNIDNALTLSEVDKILIRDEPRSSGMEKAIMSL